MTRHPVTVVGVDLSLSGTGLALIGSTGVPITLRYGSKPDAGTVASRSARLRALSQRIFTTIDAAKPTLVVVEQPAYMSDTGKVHDRSGLWWLVVARLTGHGYPVAEVTPQQLKIYATGNGGAAKDAVLAAVIRRHPEVPIGGNDEADALTLAAMGCRSLGFPIEASLPQTHLRAMTKVAWPPPKGSS